MGAGEGNESGSSPGVKPGALTALLKEIAVAPEEAQGTAWEGLLRAGAIVGRFELVRELGHGGFGVVWEARDRELGRSVAFKAVRAGGKTPEREDRLFQEAEAAARLQHPNIVTLHDVGRAEQGPYLILELLEGRTLAERRAQGALSLREALRIGVEVAKGVAHAHAHGVVHRDLTPGNVFLCDDGQVKVLDFGLAHAFGQRKVDGGTRAYMAPEQARGAPEDERTDVFALGVILHEMLSGELPFPDAEALASSSPAPGLEMPEAPALGELVGRMLEKDPVKRPRDAGEVLSALTAFQRELERLPSTGSAQVRTRRPSPGFRDLFAELKRRRVVRALLGYAIVSFAILQIAEPVLHGLHLPDSTLSVIVVLLGIGFPITVALAWVFDLTAGGLATTPNQEGTRLRGPRLALLLVGLGVLAGAPGLAWYFLGQRSTLPAGGSADVAPAPPGPPSVAVLPFADMSPQKDQEYFADGIAEEILNALAQVESLHVSGRTSSFSFKGKPTELAEIGRRLNVATVLEGSVRKAGSRVRITAQLVSTSDGFHLWSRTFDRDLTDVFAVQEEIARDVVEALKVKLLSGRVPTTSGTKTGNPEVYNQYLLGKEFQRRGSLDDYRRALLAYEKALAIDPGYAPAWAGAAAAIVNVEGLSDETHPEQEQRAVAAAEHAIALAPDLAEGYYARAMVRRGFGFDWAGALADVERALSLAPNYAWAEMVRAQMLRTLGKRSEAIAAASKATELEPLDAWVWVVLGQTYDGSNDDRAREAMTRALEISPAHEAALSNLSSNLVLAGKPRDALDVAKRSRVAPRRLTVEALAQHGLGNAKESQAALDELIARYASTWAYQIAQIHAWRGENDRAFEWLERAYAQRDPGLLYTKVDRLLIRLRDDPRWKPFLRRMNLPVD